MSYNNYKYRNAVQNNKKPENTHLIFETSYGLYFVDSADNTVLLKTTDKGATTETVVDRDRNIMYGYYDRDNERLYLFESNQDKVRVTAYYIDLTDDSVNSSASSDDYYKAADIFWVDSKNKVYYIREYHYPANQLNFSFTYFNNVQDWSTEVGDITLRTYDYGYFTNIGDDAYQLFKFSDQNVKLWKADFSANDFSALKDCGANTELPAKNRRAISYDGSDLLYFVLQDTSDSKYYLYSYSISGDNLTKIGEYNVALMLDRNTASGVLEKGFHLTLPRIYQICSSKDWLYHIATLTTTKTIQAITDNYVILE